MINEKQRNGIIQMLKYAAAALSIVSFTTTLHGLNGIVTDDTFLAGLISFGIQAVILVMGLWFIVALKTIWKQKIRQWLKRLIIGLMILLYLGSIAFSSFFSFVYLSNAAYDGVRSTDYNMELEMFLVENTREIKNINNAISNVLLQKIREDAPKFSNLLSVYKENATNNIQVIVGSKEKNDMSTIPESLRFDYQIAVNNYRRAFYNITEDTMTSVIAECQALETQINTLASYYDTIYYPYYSNLFDELIVQSDTSKANSRIEEISNKITEIENHIKGLEGIENRISAIDNYVQTCLTGIISQYNILIGNLNDISNTYEEINSNTSVVDGNSLDLQSFYEVIYSSDVLSEQELEQSINELKQIVTTYIKNTSEINEADIASLSLCIAYLEELNKCKQLERQIEEFEETQLNQAYIIIYPTESEIKTTVGQGEVIDVTEKVAELQDVMQSTGLNDFNYSQMYESEWNEARHKDVASFITILKALPDFEQILPSTEQDGMRLPTNDSNINYLIKKDEEKFISTVLAKAYEYNREKLENISEMERAWNFLFSGSNFLAIFCFIIAIFLDIASFLIGLYLYACQEERSNE